MEAPQHKVAQLLSSGGACWRCQLRHQLPLPPDAAYEDEAAAKALGCSFLPRPEAPAGLCPLCFGLLEGTLAEDDSFGVAVREAMVAEDRENDCFQLSVSTPVCLLLRDAAARLELAFASSSKADDAEAETEAEAVRVDLRAELAAIEEAKSVWKRLQRRHLAKVLGLPYYNARTAEAEVAGKEVFPLQIEVNFTCDADEAECSAVIGRLGTAKEPQRSRRKGMALHGWAAFTHAGSLAAMAASPACRLRQLLAWPRPAPSPPAGLLRRSLALLCGPVFIAGRYTKHSRHLSQTPWFVDGERRMESSVEELIADPLVAALAGRAVNGSAYTFSSSGREDKDVRTLGRGRPFLLEMADLCRPMRLQRPDCLAAVQRAVPREAEGKVAVRDLQVVSKADSKRLKEGEEEKRKCYEALCWSEQPITPEDLAKIDVVRELEVEQDTPIRVLHRRTLMTRRRTIHELTAKQEDEHHLRLRLVTQAGTYVKEFVHGDLGRTRPNLGSLVGKNYDILLLDVTEVCFDWPPEIKEEEEERAGGDQNSSPAAAS